MKVEITMEKTIRMAKVFEVTEEQINELINGENPFYDEMEKELEQDGWVEYDYTVNDEEGNTLVDWD